MKLVRLLLDTMYKIPVVNKAEPLIEAVDAALFGTKDTTTAGPHMIDGIDSKRFMTCALVGIAPAALASIYFFGLRALMMIIVSYAAGISVEFVFAVVRKHKIHEGFFVTGLIFPLVLPPTTPLWVVAVGVIFGVLFGKEMFGGTGRNIFNPALVGRLFITIAFPAIMTTSWLMPITEATFAEKWLTPFGETSITDSITAATPLSVYKTAGDDVADQTISRGQTVNLNSTMFSNLGTLSTHTATIDWGDHTAVEAETVSDGPPGSTSGANGTVSGNHVYADSGVYKVTLTVIDDDGASASDTLTVTVMPSTIDLLIGNTAGSMGETCRIAIIIGGLILLLTKAANWRIPVTYLGSVLLFGIIGSHFMPQQIAPPAFQLLSGGLLFGAFFMATDPVTSPFTTAGKYIFGIMCGILTVLIRSFSVYVEGVMFSIVIMNALTPLIDHIVLSFRYKPVKL